MKNVRKTIVTVAATTVITLFVTESAAPERPSTLVAPPFLTCARTFSTTWYLRSRKPSRPRPWVRSWTYVGDASTKPFTSSTSFGTKLAPTTAITPITIR